MPQERRGPEQIEIEWRQAWRIIASRFPPVDVFERISTDPAMWETLAELEQATNPRVRDEIGEISLVPVKRRVVGPGASYVMAPFTHVNPKGSRFSDGSYGVYYCAESLETAIAETVHHFQLFARESGDPERYEDMRVIVGAVDHELHDVATISKQRLASVMDRESYVDSRPFG